MSVDAVLFQSNNCFDFTVDAKGDIDNDNFFDTALYMSLLCEKRATASEVQSSRNRRGWIGNEQGNGFEIGSKLWLFEQERATATMLSNIEKVAFDGLKWLIEDNYAISITVKAALKNNMVTLTINIERPGSKVDKRFYELWNNTGSR